jgi:membrane-associated protein
MLHSPPAWQKNALRILVWSFAVAVVWSAWQGTLSAQGNPGIVVEANVEAPGIWDGNFWGQLFANILDSRALMELLGRPEYAIPAFIALNLIVFVETGLLIGFFLPGDSLLVIVGLICANEQCQWNMPALLVSLTISAIVGDTVGYWIGAKAGPKIFTREKSLFFAKDHLLKAQAFYEKHGAITIILARFMPFLRTFAPVVAGVGKMEYKKFFAYNVIGGIAWVFSMVLAGRYLPAAINPVVSSMIGRDFQIENHIEAVVITIVFLSILPIVWGWLKKKLTSGGPTAEVQPATPTAERMEEALVK